MSLSQFSSVLSFIRGGAIAMLVLFALTPCLVKDTILESFELTHIRQINKTQVVLENNPCQSRHSETLILEEEQSQEYDASVSGTKTGESFLPTFYSASLERPDSKTPSHYYPPKYILFKRLKIAIV